MNLSAAATSGIWVTRQKEIETITPSGTIARFWYPSLTFGSFGASQTPGPDGRFWISTITYNTLWAWTPQTRGRSAAPEVSISKLGLSRSVRGHRTLMVALACHGQPGRFCAGTITALGLRAHQYALSPQTDLTLHLGVRGGVQAGASIRVTVANQDPITRRGSLVHRTTTAP